METDDLKKIIKKAEEKNLNIKNIVKNKFLLAIKLIFNNKNIQEISWSQYTPYFNDGEECVFAVGDLQIKALKEINMANEMVKAHAEKHKLKDFNEFFYSDKIDDNMVNIELCYNNLKIIKNFGVLLKNEDIKTIHNLYELKEIISTDFFENVLKETLGDHTHVIITRKGEDEIEVNLEKCDHD